MTLRDLYRATLEQLQVAAAGEPVAPEDVKLIESKYVGIYDMLLTKGLVSWGATGDVPEYAVLPLTDMLAYACAAAFGKNPADYAVQGALDLPTMSIAERQLRNQLARNYVSCTQRTEYY